MLDKIQKLLSSIITKTYSVQLEVEINRPEEQYGDYATNSAMQLAKQLNRSPADLASELTNQLKVDPLFSEVNVAGPGFINMKLTNKAVIEQIFEEPNKPLIDQVVVTEYSDPNPFKVLHGGHLYTSVIGDSIANLMVTGGARVKRVNFGGDVGLHVARSIWAILKDLGGELPDKLNDIKADDRSDWLSHCYVSGNEAYESNDQAKKEIQELNKRIYEIAVNQDKSSSLGKIYWTCREWSYQYFEDFYGRLGIKFDKYYPESEVAELGAQTVKAHMPAVYQESQGAIVFNGEKYGLHTNVFINSKGLPTYAAKDVGLIMQKWQDYHFNVSVIITANDILDYMRLVLKSVEQFEPNLTKSTIHITHGMVKLTGGSKMSSRKGNILKATDILDLANQASLEKELNNDPKITIGAVKYAFLKQRIGGDIVYDPAESVSLDGNSGPYVQYAYARAKSILEKAGSIDFDLRSTDDLTDSERSLTRKIGEYKEVVELAVSELRPHHIATYLFELAQAFNRFYENNRVIGDDRQELRTSLIKAYSLKLADGLKLLGIETLEHM